MITAPLSEQYSPPTDCPLSKPNCSVEKIIRISLFSSSRLPPAARRTTLLLADGRAGGGEPGPCGRSKRGADRFQYLLMVAIKPGPFLGRHQCGLQQTPIERRQREGLEPQERLHGTRQVGGLRQQQVLQPDAIVVRQIESGLVRQDHP